MESLSQLGSASQALVGSQPLSPSFMDRARSIVMLYYCSYRGDALPGSNRRTLISAIVISVCLGQWLATHSVLSPLAIIPFALGCALWMAVVGFLLLGLFVCPASYLYLPMRLLEDLPFYRHWKSHSLYLRLIDWRDNLLEFSMFDFWGRSTYAIIMSTDGSAPEFIRRSSYVRDIIFPNFDSYGPRLRQQYKRRFRRHPRVRRFIRVLYDYTHLRQDVTLSRRQARLYRPAPPPEPLRMAS